MKMKGFYKEPDYKAIRDMGHRIDCMVTEADFSTSYPNPYRIDYAVSDINRYAKVKGTSLNQNTDSILALINAIFSKGD